jgi:ribosomal protein S18 acetylase RimI-like enzyme
MDDIIHIRTADPADAGAIEALTRQAYAKWVGLIGREPLPMRVDYADAVKRHRFDLLYVGRRLAALVETVPEDDCLLIVNVAVRPELQGRGLGSRLLQLAEDRAASLGLSGTRLYTNKMFVANIRLYEARGYRVQKEAPLNGGVLVFMMKPRRGD